MKTETITEKSWDQVLAMHKLFTDINEAVIKNYKNTTPLEVLNLIFGPVVYDAVVTLYPDDEVDQGYYVRVERIDEKTKYNLDLNTMPRGRGGFFGSVVDFSGPEIFSDISDKVTDEDKRVIPWITRMKTALVVPTIAVTAEPATTIVFTEEANGFTYDQIYQNIILTYAITNILLNLLLRRETEKAYQALDRELNTIGRIQRQLLPKELPDIHGSDWAVHYSTSARAGGDYYDFFPLPEKQTGVIIADVSGHGSPAAVVMAMTRLLLHTYPGQVSPPAEVLRNMNDILMGHILPGQFVTAFYAIIDPGKNTLAFSNAGHCYPRIFRARTQTIEVLKVKGGLPLGVSHYGGFCMHKVNLNRGDIILFFTDGITEAFNAEEQMYGEERLEKILADSYDQPVESIKENILKDVNSFCNGVPFKDDITLIVVKII